MGRRRHRRHLARIDPEHERGRRRRSPLGQSASGVAVGAGGVWVTVRSRTASSGSTPPTNAVKDTVRVAARPARWRSGPVPCGSPAGAAGSLTRSIPGSALTTRYGSGKASGHRGDRREPCGWRSRRARPAWSVSAAALRRAEGDPAGGVNRGRGPGDRLWGPAHPRSDVRAAAELSRPAVSGGRAAAARGRRPMPHGDGWRAHLHLPRAPRLSLLAPFQRAGPRAARSVARSSAGSHPRRCRTCRPGPYWRHRRRRRLHAGRVKHIAGVTARGDTLTIRLTAPSATLPARMAPLVLRSAAHDADQRSPAPSGSRWRARTTSPPSCPSAMLLRRNPNYQRLTAAAEMREINIDLRGLRRVVAAVERRARRLPSTRPADVSARSIDCYGPEQRCGTGRAPAVLQRPRSGPALLPDERPAAAVRRADECAGP